MEPNVGLSLDLPPEPARGLVLNLCSCEMQAEMLMDALHRLAGYYQQDGHPIRELNWPNVHTRSLEDVSAAQEQICQWLKTVFLDGRLRAQGGNSVKAVAAASSFRAMEDVRLKIVADWSINFQDFLDAQGFHKSDPVAIMTLGITTTFILEICRNMQKAGKNLEEIAYKFPAFK